MPVPPLPPEALRRPADGEGLSFETTDELPDLDGLLGQERAAEALALAVAVRADGWNAYVMGPPGAGRHALVLATLERAGLDLPTPSDWCYVNDFAEARRPRALELPAGRAAALRREVDALVAELRLALPAAFESKDHRARLQQLERELETARERMVDEIRARAEPRGVALLRTPMGFAFAPQRGGEVLDPDQFHALPEPEQERTRAAIEELQALLQEALRTVPDLERRHRERVKAANREVALAATGHLLDALRRRWADLPEVLAHLDAVQADLLEVVHDVLSGSDGEPAQSLRKALADSPALRRYAVNVMVDHAGTRGAPVVHEDLPTLANLTGRIEHHAHFGTLVTDFTLVRAGALHRSNGGFLVLDARRVLAQPFAWDELKRALRAREIRIEPPERLLGLGATASLEPAPIPLDVKVVLVGDRWVHRLLSAADPEFDLLFKVEADFEDELERTPEAEAGLARLVAGAARRGGLRPFHRAAVVRVIHETARRAGDATRLAADMAAVDDLLREADQHAAAAGRPLVSAEDVAAAAAAAERRAGRVRELLRREIRRGTLVVETSGTRVGQVNGLAVAATGRVPFGFPSRITARVRLGKGEVVDIQREVELGGPVHSKGVLILAGWLGGRYGAETPLAVSATLVFEQTYGAVEGDSASVAEACALVSAVGELPLDQALAVTGSLDQHGRVQAVGGVTEKIEGFFEVCRERGLDGRAGVVIPRANVPQLCLRDEVVAAVAGGRFRIFAVERVEEALELLTGQPAGTRDAEGRFPPGSLDARVAGRLAAFAERARAFAAPPAPAGAAPA